MEGIEKLQKKIMKDADAEIRCIRDNAKAQVDSISAESRDAIRSYKKNFDERTESLVIMLRQQKLAQAVLKSKKDKLEKRETLINGFLGDALKSLDFKGKAYQNLLEDVLKSGSSVLGKKITVACNGRDSAIVKKIAASLKITAKVETDNSLDGGMILENSDGKKIDESISSLLERKKDDIRQEISRMISEK